MNGRKRRFVSILGLLGTGFEEEVDWPTMDCIVEVFGVSRHILKASQVRLDLPPEATLEEVVAALGQREAQLLGRVVAPDMNALIPPYMFYQEGRGFVDDLSQRVEPGDRFVIMFSAVGG